MALSIVPLDHEVWSAFCAFHKDRGLSPPPVPQQGIFVAHNGPDGPVLACGVCLYKCDAGYVFAEHLAASPALQAKVVHEAVTIMVEALKVYAATNTRLPVIAASKPALVKMLEREGFSTTGAQLYFSPPVWSPKAVVKPIEEPVVEPVEASKPEEDLKGFETRDDDVPLLKKKRKRASKRAKKI